MFSPSSLQIKHFSDLGFISDFTQKKSADGTSSITYKLFGNERTSSPKDMVLDIENELIDHASAQKIYLLTCDGSFKPLAFTHQTNGDDDDVTLSFCYKFLTVHIMIKWDSDTDDVDTYDALYANVNEVINVYYVGEGSWPSLVHALVHDGRLTGISLHDTETGGSIINYVLDSEPHTLVSGFSIEDSMTRQIFSDSIKALILTDEDKVRAKTFKNYRRLGILTDLRQDWDLDTWVATFHLQGKSGSFRCERNGNNNLDTVRRQRDLLIDRVNNELADRYSSTNILVSLEKKGVFMPHGFWKQARPDGQRLITVRFSYQDVVFELRDLGSPTLHSHHYMQCRMHTVIMQFDSISEYVTGNMKDGHIENVFFEEYSEGHPFDNYLSFVAGERRVRRRISQILDIRSTIFSCLLKFAEEDAAKEGVVKEGVVKEGVAKEGVAKEGVAKEQIVKEGVAKEQLAKEQLAKEQLAKEKVMSVSANSIRVHLSGPPIDDPKLYMQTLTSDVPAKEGIYRILNVVAGHVTPVSDKEGIWRLSGELDLDMEAVAECNSLDSETWVRAAYLFGKVRHGGGWFIFLVNSETELIRGLYRVALNDK